MLLRTALDSEKTALHAIQPTNQSIYWKKLTISALTHVVSLFRRLQVGVIYLDCTIFGGIMWSRMST